MGRGKTRQNNHGERRETETVDETNGARKGKTRIELLKKIAPFGIFAPRSEFFAPYTIGILNLQNGARGVKSRLEFL